MAENSKIEWTDATYNPITGCSVVSPGCTNCYAMRLAGGRLRNHPSRAGLTTPSKAGPVWNGEVRLNEQWLDQPLQWSRPRMIFVCAHGDLFHENVPDEWIDRVFAVMALCPQHTFQVLTKRSKRMRSYLAACFSRDGRPLVAIGNEVVKPGICYRNEGNPFATKPLPNVWLGVSSEDQARADERIPDLLATPAAVRFVSYEPALGPIDFTRVRAPKDSAEPEAEWLFDALAPGDTYEQRFTNCLGETWYDTGDGPYCEHRLDWIICGGESGPNARPMYPQWARDVRDQCTAAGVPFFMKQMTKKAPIPDDLFVREMPHANP